MTIFVPCSPIFASGKTLRAGLIHLGFLLLSPPGNQHRSSVFRTLRRRQNGPSRWGMRLLENSTARRHSAVVSCLLRFGGKA